MDNYIVVKTDRMGKKMYITSKTKTSNGKKLVLFTFERIIAKFYTSEKVANKRAVKLNNEGATYDGDFSVEKVTTQVSCR